MRFVLSGYFLLYKSSENSCSPSCIHFKTLADNSGKIQIPLLHGVKASKISVFLDLLTVSNNKVKVHEIYFVCARQKSS